MIGVFDSGFGGLTILKSIRRQLPSYDYLYLGDNARAPYGTRSFEVVYHYTLQAVEYLFSQGCELVVLACNTASAKALRSIQQINLPHIWQAEHSNIKRVLGIIRPTVEAIGQLTQNKHIGLLATQGTVSSLSYPIELAKIDPSIILTQQACPMWVPLIENNEHLSDGADYFVRKYIDELFLKDEMIDTILLACTHYPLLEQKLCRYIPAGVQLLSQGDIVGRSLSDYLTRHADIESRC